MRIIGFNFTKINVEKKKDIEGKLEIKSNLSMEDIKKEKIALAGDVLRFSFSFEIKYSPDFANVLLEGDIIASSLDVKKILKQWSKKKIDEDIKIPVFNFILSRCNVKALQLEEEFNLPLHIPMPRLAKQPNQDKNSANYAG